MALAKALLISGGGLGDLSIASRKPANSCVVHSNDGPVLGFEKSLEEDELLVSSLSASFPLLFVLRILPFHAVRTSVVGTLLGFGDEIGARIKRVRAECCCGVNPARILEAKC